MNPDQALDDLLGAYAVGALDADERAEIDAYLDRSPTARHEADRLTAAAAAFGEAESATERHLPIEIWSAIQSEIGRETTPLPQLRLPPVARAAADVARPRSLAAKKGRSSLPRRSRLLLAAGVAAMVAVAVFGASQLRDGSGGVGSMRDFALAALAEPGSKVGTLTSPQLPLQVRAVISADGRGYLFGEDLPHLAPDHTYQLWLLDGNEPVSLAVIGNRPAVVVFPATGRPTSLAITAELAPGVAKSQQTPIVAGLVS